MMGSRSWSVESAYGAGDATEAVAGSTSSSRR